MWQFVQKTTAKDAKKLHGVLLRGKNGAAIAIVSVPSDRRFQVSFQRKIHASDVVSGKLKETCLQQVKRRGGKRIMHVSLSEESAVSLYYLLRRELKAQGLVSYPAFRQTWKEVWRETWRTIVHTLHLFHSWDTKFVLSKELYRK